MSRNWLFVGAKVVCVDASNVSSLCAGKVYTVRCLGPLGLSSRGRMFGYGVRAYSPETIVVYLAEVRRKNYSTIDGHMLSEDFGYAPERFRQLINTDAAVSQMRELMQRAVKTQRVDA